MSTIGSIGAVDGAQGAGTAPTTKPASSTEQGQKSPIAPTSGGEQGNGPNAFSDRGIDSNMSSKDFVTLTQRAESSSGGMKDMKDMINMVLALQLLQKTMEATTEIIDNFFNSDK